MDSQPIVARLLAQVAALRAELAKTQHELKLWQAQLALAQKEIFRAQQVVNDVDRARADAEECSHRYRQSLRRLLDERAVQLARDEGRHRGYREGFQFAAAHSPVPVPPDQIRPHTNNNNPRMTLPERIADEWRSQNRDLQRPVSSSAFLRQRPLSPDDIKQSTPHNAVESPVRILSEKNSLAHMSIPPSNNTERTVVDSGLLSHRPASRKQQDFNHPPHVYPPPFIPLSPIPSPENTSFTHTRSSSRSGMASPLATRHSSASSVPVPGASSVDSRDG